MHQCNHPKQSVPRPRHGFTLVELLVVIGIIALLISILLPSLQKARRAANTVACAANMRSILQAMQMYASANKNFFPGGPNSTAAFLYKSDGTDDPNPVYSNANCPDVSQIWDWQAPIAKVWGIKFNEKGTQADREERFRQLVALKNFRCPEDPGILALTTFATAQGPNFGVVLRPSYSSPSLFHTSTPSTAGEIGKFAPTWAAVPAGYGPKVTKVGSASEKVYLMEGSRYINGATIDLDTHYRGSQGGAYGDPGPYSGYSPRAFPQRAGYKANGGLGVSGSMTLSYRHGINVGGGSVNAYRSNYGFFDGHVEALGDLDGANPNFYMPRGTVAVVDGEMWQDVITKFLKGKKTPFTAF